MRLGRLAQLVHRFLNPPQGYCVGCAEALGKERDPQFLDHPVDVLDLACLFATRGKVAHPVCQVGLGVIDLGLAVGIAIRIERHVLQTDAHCLNIAGKVAQVRGSVHGDGIRWKKEIKLLFHIVDGGTIPLGKLGAEIGILSQARRDRDY